ncbi:hypothetical protein ARAF_1590 [Arsenophonus endosymbiont of Aleurodicus floccissimus]|uniref:hypothetical protein n=1 Tax=Arsenophonus endosymbiont of Aleurodicus floccissimus TaxID=2152761 RepID=UPI000ED22F5C|nr:hypothetical protein [Arsenophonus endosymbiont of Aleurodicus floccissimus]SPP31922.1 hypothetical protein ARAF_1590 [Arsenophonus endosymbiont of Aleurodicus floccissimus]
MVTACPYEAYRDADVIIITTPIHVRDSVLKRIQPALPRNKPVFGCAIPGFGGFDWLAEHRLGTLPNIVLRGMKDVSHIVFELIRGKVSNLVALNHIFILHYNVGKSQKWLRH